MEGKSKKVCFYTLGCKVNQYETNSMKQQFKKAGYEMIEDNRKADIYVINTCTVTNMSDRKSRNMLKRVKKMNPDSIVVAVGCYVQTGKEQLSKMQEVDIILGNNEKKEIVHRVEEFEKEKCKRIMVTDVMNQKEFVELGLTTYTDKTRAVIKIQDGCNQFCSYCLIPYARGHIRSRDKAVIVQEIKQIAQKGIKEVVITGIHIASYGKDLKENTSLIDLLEKINEIEGIERIRLGSLEPTLITEEFVHRLKKLEKICDHFHLSLQSGCNATLKRMNRKYTTEEFEKSVEILRNNYSNVMLTTDIIVGFPGETEKEFESTYEFLKKIKFYKMHVFKYSPRKGTKAAEMKEQIDGKVKEKRSEILIELSNQNQAQINQQYLGKKVKVLWEEIGKDQIKGHTSNYMMVRTNRTEKQVENQIQTVMIGRVEQGELIGKM